jgi:HEAT repeat protein
LLAPSLLPLRSNHWSDDCEGWLLLRDQVRREAARTLATLAPPALEPLLLTFAISKDYVLKQFAPLALANLSTKASLSALAGMLLHTDPGTYEYMTAAENLGRPGAVY